MKNKLKSISILALISYTSSLFILVIHFLLLEHRWNPYTNTFEDLHHHHHHSETNSVSVFSEFHAHKHHGQYEHDKTCPGLSFLCKLFALSALDSFGYIDKTDISVNSIVSVTIYKVKDLLAIAPKQSPPSLVLS
jgi:hypothetical protein